MHDLDLAAVGGGSPSRKVRTGSFLLLCVLAFFTVMVAQTQDQAYALAAPPVVPAVLPAALAPAVVTSGEAAMTAYLSGSAAGSAYFAGSVATGAEVATAAAAGGAAVAAAPVVIAAGAVLLAGAAIYVGWKWKTGHFSSYADPVIAAAPAGFTWVPTNAVSTSYTSNTGRRSFTLGAPTYVSGGAALTPGVQILPGNWQFTWSPTIVSGDSNYGQGELSIECKTTAAPVTFSYVSVASGGIFSRDYGGARYVEAESNNCGSGKVTTGGIRVAGAGTYTGTNTTATMTADPAQQSGTPPATGTNPVTTTPKSQCSDGTTVTGSSVSYTGGTAESALPALLFPACPAGTTRTGISTPTTAPGVTAIPDPVTWSAPTIPSAFADCNVIGTSCQLNLYRVGHGTPAAQLSCDASGDCAEWQSQTQRSGALRTVKTLLGGTYSGVSKSPGDDVSERSRVWPNGDTAECFWGPYEIEVDGCTVVPTEQAKGTTAGTDAEAKSDGDGGSCFPTGWAMFNPVEWVYKPVKCALVWAFVPSQATIDAAVARLQNAYNGTALATVATAVDTVYAPITALGSHSPGDCDGPAFVIPQLPTMPQPLTLHPLSTCPPLVAYILGIYLPIATAAIYIGGFFAGTRRILKAFGADGPDGDDT